MKHFAVTESWTWKHATWKYFQFLPLTSENEGSFLTNCYHAKRENIQYRNETQTHSDVMLTFFSFKVIFSFLYSYITSITPWCALVILWSLRMDAKFTQSTIHSILRICNAIILCSKSSLTFPPRIVSFSIGVL